MPQRGPWNLLFDIDGTLLLTGGAGRRGMQRALFRLFGAVDPPPVSMHGRTDFAISRDFIGSLGLPFDRHYHAFREAYLLELQAELAARNGRVLPGVLPLLEALRLDGRFQMGLLTGNAQRAADSKMRTYQIEHFFQFGGYGDWHEDRADVARQALDAARRHGGSPADMPPALVIGDTPADVACARAVGAKIIAVATGNCSREELHACQPDWLLDTLEGLTVETLVGVFQGH